MKNLLLLLLIHCTIFLPAQYELVADLNPGDDDTDCYCDFNGTFEQQCAVALNESVTLIKLSTEETNWELYSITTAGIELVMDIAPGNTDSRIDQMTLYKDKIYFVANDGSGHTVWESDGTTEGTKMAFGLGTGEADDVNGFIVGRDDRLYFEFKTVIYSFDGTDLFEFQHPNAIWIIEEGNENSRNWCRYKDGIAVMDYQPFDSELLAINSDGIKLLATHDAPLTEPYGMAEFEDGLIFNLVEDNDDSDGFYSVNTLTGEITKLSDEPARVVRAINQKSCIAKSGAAYLIFDKENPLGRNIHESDLQITLGEDWATAGIGANLLYQSTEGFFLDETYSFYDGATGSSTEIYVAEREVFGVTQIGSYGVFGGSSNGGS